MKPTLPDNLHQFHFKSTAYSRAFLCVEFTEICWDFVGKFDWKLGEYFVCIYRANFGRAIKWNHAWCVADLKNNRLFINFQFQPKHIELDWVLTYNASTHSIFSHHFTANAAPFVTAIIGKTFTTLSTILWNRDIGLHLLRFSCMWAKSFFNSRFRSRIHHSLQPFFSKITSRTCKK